MNSKEPRDPARSPDEIDLPADPADLFVLLYDTLPTQYFSNHTARKWFKDQKVRKRAELVCEDVLSDGFASVPLIRDIIAEHGDEGVFSVLMGLDRSFEVAGLYAGETATPAMADIGWRYLSTSSLNTNTKHAGLLLPRYTRPSRVVAAWTRKADFFSVHRVTPADCEGIWHGGILENEPGFPGKAIAVGSAPLLERHTDLKFEFPEDADIGLYRISPADDELLPRIDVVLRNLEASGAEIGVLPEYTMSEDLIKHWDTLLHNDPAPNSKLQWILIGTGPVAAGPVGSGPLGTGPLGCSDPPPNRAMMVDRQTARVLWWQDKMAGFTLGEGQAAEWQLPGRPKHEPAAEDITHGEKVAVLETALGRVAILICEDIKQSATWLGKCQAFGVSHIFVPLFASPISKQQRRWERDAAEHCVEQLGTWVVLANSLAVGKEMRITPPLDPEDCFNCAVVGPAPAPPTKYTKYPTQFCRSSSGTDLARVVCDEDGRPPEATPGALPPLPVIWAGRPE
ncbi:hypothetical protein ACQEV2_09855 [Streptomyces sp. CA-251387]|uniref:hypothetical protein n=1 Tax=Streptomyces sp. CA-251387 TaxID=3240064 RepID=UPI003D8E1081